MSTGSLTSGVMRTLAVVDAGPLVASLDRRERHHARCVEVLRRPDLQLVIPAMVVAEVAYFAGKRFGARVESVFARGLGSMDIEAPHVEDWPIIADLVERYSDLGLGTTDAATAVLADRLGTDLIVTLDRRHFETVRSSGGNPFRLLPEFASVHEEHAAYARL